MNRRNIILLAAIIVLLVPLLVYKLVNNFDLINKSLLPKRVNLTQGKIVNHQNSPSNIFVEQKPEICNTDNLSGYFGQALVDKPTIFESFPKSSGETNWWVVLQGIVTNIESQDQQLKVTLEKEKSTVNLLVFIGETRIGTKHGPSESKLISKEDLQIGDDTTFFLTVKCGDNITPQSTVSMVYSLEFVARIK